jgi:CDP-4-dehydro-6-deoxyglucose reductase
VSEVAAPGELPVHEVRCRILELEPLNHDVTRVWLRLPADPAVHWYAGQYLELLMPDGPCPFSIASAPGAEQFNLELHVRQGEANSYSLKILSTLRANETMDVRLPSGGRYINTLPDSPVWFVCGSTGFAPAKAMIEYLRKRSFHKPVKLFWGARARADLYLDALPRAWQADMPSLEYIPVLSEQAEPGLASGLAHEAAVAQLPAEETPLIHVAGSPVMAWTAFDALVAAGLPPERIHSDVFDYAPR